MPDEKPKKKIIVTVGEKEFDSSKGTKIKCIELQYEWEGSRNANVNASILKTLEFSIQETKFGGKELGDVEDYSEEVAPALWAEMFRLFNATANRHRSMLLPIDEKKAGFLKRTLGSGLEKKLSEKWQKNKLLQRLKPEVVVV